MQKKIIVLTSIDIAKSRGWRKFWIEADCLMVVKVCSNHNLIPRSLRNIWSESTDPPIISNLILTHIFKKENSCADFFLNIGLSANSKITF